MSRSRIAVLVLFFAALLVPTVPASASYSVLCSGYTSCEKMAYATFGYSTAQRTSYWRMYTGTNCTNYVAYRLVKTNGMPNIRPKAGVGNARDWGTAMSSITDSTPAQGSVAWFGKGGRSHVAYVEKVVSATEILVSESNWSGTFDWRRITKSGSGWPDGFIHFADPGLKNVTKPAVSGTAAVGKKLTATAGSWSLPGASYAYQWLADGKVVAGATKSSLTPTPDELGQQLSVQVKASKSGEKPTSATSAATKRVGPGALAVLTAPSVSGPAKVGSRLTAAPGTWSPDADYSYQWFVGTTPIADATKTTYIPGADLRGDPLHVRVTAREDGYTTNSADSAPTGAVAKGVIELSAPATVTGSPRLGLVVTADPGTFAPTTATRTYQWLRDGRSITGQTGRTHKVTTGDLGTNLSVIITYAAPAYTTRSVTTPATGNAKAVTALKATAKTGTKKVTFTITASAGDASPPNGTVVIAMPDGTQKTITVKAGKAAVALTKQKSGKQTYGFHFLHSSTATGASYRKTVTIG